MSTHDGLASSLKIFALGTFEIHINGRLLNLDGAMPGRPLALLQGLLPLGGRGISRQRLSAALWPDSEGDAAYRALITNLFRLRRILKCRQAVQLVNGTLRLDPERCWVDAWAFERDLDASADPAVVVRALQLYHGPFLGDAEHPLAYETRERLQRKFVRATLNLGASLQRRGDIGASLSLYERGLDVEPGCEDLHRARIELYTQLDQRAAAAQAYQQCRAALARQFGATPSIATERAYRAGGGGYRGVTPVGAVSYPNLPAAAAAI